MRCPLPPIQPTMHHLGIRSICLLYLSSPSAAFIATAATSASNGKTFWRSDQHSDGKIRFSALTALAHQNEKQGGQAKVEEEEASADGIAESGVFLHGFEADLDQKMDGLEAQFEEYKEFSGSSAGIDNEVTSKADDGSKDDETEIPATTTTDLTASANYGYASTGDRQLTAAQLDEEYPAPYYTPPPNFFALASNQFVRNLDSMLGRKKNDAATNKIDETASLRAKLNLLLLSSHIAWDLESIAGGSLGVMKEPLALRVPYHLLCSLIDLLYEQPDDSRKVNSGSAMQRLYVMEKVGRAPYLSFLSMLNLYEAFGLWRSSEALRVAHAHQELSKFRRQRVIEQLGGDQPWTARFIAEHAALLAHTTIVHLWFLSPSLAYRFAQMIESHAFHTYDAFLEQNESALKLMPLPSTSDTDTKTAESNLYEMFSSFKEENSIHSMRLTEAYYLPVVLNAADSEKKLFLGLFVTLIALNFLPSGLGDGTFASLFDKMPGWL